MTEGVISHPHHSHAIAPVMELTYVALAASPIITRKRWQSGAVLAARLAMIGLMWRGFGVTFVRVQAAGDCAATGRRPKRARVRPQDWGGIESMKYLAAALPLIFGAVVSAAPLMASPTWTPLDASHTIRSTDGACRATLDGRPLSDCRRIMLARLNTSVALLLDPAADDPDAEANRARVQVLIDGSAPKDDVYPLTWVNIAKVGHKATGTCLFQMQGKLTCTAVLDHGQRFAIVE